jgi:Transglycosylase SLT domain
MVAITRSGGGTDPTAAALAEIPGSRSATLLEQQRQQMILEDSAAKTLSLVGTPRLATRPKRSSGSTSSPSPSPSSSSSPTGGSPPPVTTATAPTPGTNRSIAWNMLPSFGFDPKTSFSCVDNIFSRESSWNQFAENASGAYGIAQALPYNKMPQAAWPASAGGRSDPTAQIGWGLGYMKSTYGSPCNAWSFWQAHGWY